MYSWIAALIHPHGVGGEPEALLWLEALDRLPSGRHYRRRIASEIGRAVPR